MFEYFVVLIDKVTEQFSDLKVLLSHLRYLTLHNQKPNNLKAFLDPFLIEEISSSVLSLLKRSNSNISNCCAQERDCSNG